MKEKNKILFIDFLMLTLVFSLLVSAQQNNFNLKVEITDSHKSVLAGEDVWFTTRIMNLGGDKRMDITLNYEVFDGSNKLVAKKTETVAIETQASFVGSVQVPSSAVPGSYRLEVLLFVGDTNEARGNSSFEVVKEKSPSLKYFLIFGVVGVALVVVLVLIYDFKGLIERFKIKSRVHNIVQRRLRKN